MKKSKFEKLKVGDTVILVNSYFHGTVGYVEEPLHDGVLDEVVKVRFSDGRACVFGKSTHHEHLWTRNDLKKLKKVSVKRLSKMEKYDPFAVVNSNHKSPSFGEVGEATIGLGTLTVVWSNGKRQVFELDNIFDTVSHLAFL